MGRLGKWAHDHLGWHSPAKGSKHIPYMDISVNATCRYCGKRILQDSQGGWFLAPVQYGAKTTRYARYTVERTCKNEWADYRAFRCSECWLQIEDMQTNSSSGNWLPNYCPNCGAKVVEK